MIRSTILLSFIIMFFTVASYAQKKRGRAMQWKIAAQLPATNGQANALGFAGPVAGIHENRLIVAGGANFPDSMPWLGGKKKYYDDVYVYIREDKKIALHPGIFKLPSTIAYPANCSTPKGIVYAGGENEKGISNKVILLQWDAVTKIIITKTLPDLPIAVTNAAATVHNNIVYIAGGETATAASDRFYSLDIDNNEAGWKELPAIPKPVSHTVLTVQSNADHTSIYLAGGRKRNANGISDLYASVYEFDLKKNQWKEKTALPYALSAGTGIATDKNCFLLFGGDKGEIFNKTEILIAAINAEKDETKKQGLIQKKNKLQSLHPGFSKDVLLYEVVKNKWTVIGNIPFNTPVTTTAVKWDKYVMIPNGEIRAGVRTPQILKARLR
jgi:N-acetylneuraminate epimerase